MSGGEAERPLRVLMCLLYYLPHRTGMQLYIQRLSEALVKRGHRVTILAARHQRGLPPEETTSGGRIVRLWTPPIRMSRGVVMPSYPFAARKLIAQHDIVHGHTPLLEAGLLGRLAKSARRPLLFTHHGDLVLPGGVLDRLIEKTMFQIYRSGARAADAIVAYSEDYAQSSRYIQPFRDKCEVIAPPIEMPRPTPAGVARWKARLTPDGEAVIGYVGRIVREKRPDLLIHALDAIGCTHPGARVAFAGVREVAYEKTWRELEPLTERYGERVRFLGPIEDPQGMADFYAACDVLALPSDTECFGLVQVEAMLCGCPVVVADTPGARVPVRETGMGRIVPRGDVAKLGEALAEVISDRARYVRPRDEIEQIYSLDETVDLYEQLYRRLCA